MRAASARYAQTEKGRAANRLRQCRHRQTELRRAWCARYQQTEEYRAAQAQYRRTAEFRAAWARYSRSEKGRATFCKRSAKRRARTRGASILESVDRRTILALDGGLCHLCDLPVDPQAFHLDHIIPLSVAPIHADFNAAVAHPTCNQRKYARALTLSPTARARWQARRPQHLALLDEHFTRLAA